MATTTDADGNIIIMDTVTVYFTAEDAVTVTAALPQASGTDESSSSTSSSIISSNSAAITSSDTATSTLSVATSSNAPLATPMVISSSVQTTSISTTSPSSSLSTTLDTSTLSLPVVKGITSIASIPTSLLATSDTVLQSSITSISSSSATAAAVSGTPTALTDDQANGNTDYHKQAVVGGLAGAMGGAVFLALLFVLCCCGRRRWKRKSDNEKQAQAQRPALLANEHSFWGPTPYLAGHNRNSMKSFRTVDGTLIRVNLDKFSRPFNEKEGWRESVGPRRLMVMNPDKSLPGTPNVAADSIPGFFGSYKASLAPTMPAMPKQVVYADRKHAPKLPVFHSYEGLSKEFIAPSEFRNSKSPSVHTTRTVRQHPPDDPFRDDYAYEQDDLPLQRTATHDWAAFGSALTPFVSRASTAQPDSRSAMHSVSTVSLATSGRVSSIHDPFELESPEVRQEPRFIMQRSPRAARIRTYDGT